MKDLSYQSRTEVAAGWSKCSRVLGRWLYYDVVHEDASKVARNRISRIVWELRTISISTHLVPFSAANCRWFVTTRSGVPLPGGITPLSLNVFGEGSPSLAYSSRGRLV